MITPQRLLAGVITLGLALAPALATTPAAASPGSFDATWAQFHNSRSRAGVTHAETLITRDTVHSLAVRWRSATFKTPEGINSSPVVARGKVYIGSDDGRLWAFRARTGARRWRFHTGGAVRGAAAVAGGRVYVGTAAGAILALDADNGKPRWSYGIGGNVTASPLVVHGTVYIGSRGGMFVALNARTGRVKWKARTWSVWDSAAYADGLVYVASDKMQVAAFNAKTGAERWVRTTGVRMRSAPAVRGGRVFAGGDDGGVWAFHARKGRLLWHSAAAPSRTNATVRSGPAVSKGRVFVTTGETTPMDGHAVAFDTATGKRLWRSHLADYSTSSPAVANGLVFLGSFDHRLYAFDAATGRERWTSGWDAMHRGLNSSPAIANGFIFVGCRDGSLYAYRPVRRG